MPPCTHSQSQHFGVTRSCLPPIKGSHCSIWNSSFPYILSLSPSLSLRDARLEDKNAQVECEWEIAYSPSIFKTVYFLSFDPVGLLSFCLFCRAMASGEAAFFITSVTSSLQPCQKFWATKSARFNIFVRLWASSTLYKLMLRCEFSPGIGFLSFSVRFLQTSTDISLALMVLQVEFLIQDINAVVMPIDLFNPALADLRLALCSISAFRFLFEPGDKQCQMLLEPSRQTFHPHSFSLSLFLSRSHTHFLLIALSPPRHHFPFVIVVGK